MIYLSSEKGNYENCTRTNRKRGHNFGSKIFTALNELGDVNVVLTESAKHFIDNDVFGQSKVYSDSDEWEWRVKNHLGEKYSFSASWTKDDPVLHIELGKNATALVIAPATMNTIAKMANGIADNLLTSVYAAWDKNRPVIIAPAMNERMWFSQANQQNVKTLLDRGIFVINPIEKLLACGRLRHGGYG